MNLRGELLQSDSLSPYFYIVLLREWDSATGKQMERDRK